MKTSEKNLLLDKLTFCYTRVNYLKTLCEEQGKTEDAKQLERRKARLKLEIDGLLHDLFREWIGGANELKGKLDKTNEAVKKSIESIEKNVKVAENIVKVIGYADDAIKIATDLVA